MAVKITFGIQPNMLKRIEEVSKYWEKLGEEFGWCPFTLALHYFKHLNKIENAES